MISPIVADLLRPLCFGLPQICTAAVILGNEEPSSREQCVDPGTATACRSRRNPHFLGKCVSVFWVFQAQCETDPRAQTLAPHTHTHANNDVPIVESLLGKMLHGPVGSHGRTGCALTERYQLFLTSYLRVLALLL